MTAANTPPVLQLAALGIPYEMRGYGDGPRDGTGTLLEALARERPNLVATRKPNSGHGPTILRRGVNTPSRMWKAAFTSFAQTVRAALAARRGVPS